MFKTTGFILGSMLLALSAAGVEVEAERRAEGDAPAARQQALTDALREAVRSGAGVDLLSESQMENFELTFDRTFSKARGYVKKYEVLEAGLTDDGFYTVKIKADVGKHTLWSEKHIIVSTYPAE
jgi:hypothetical protein